MLEQHIQELLILKKTIILIDLDHPYASRMLEKVFQEIFISKNNHIYWF